MDAAEEIPQLVCADKKLHVDAETMLDSPTPMVSVAKVLDDDDLLREINSPTPMVSVAKVLDDDDLLREIIVRVGFPTTLVCAALVCKRWLGHASDPKFLSRFRKLHPPRLLGYYITEWSRLNDRLDAPRFVPMLPHPPELSAVIRRLESYNFGANEIMHCRNGSVFTRCLEGPIWTHGVHHPLCVEKGTQIVPQFPHFQDHSLQKFGAIVSREEGSNLSYLYVLAGSTEEAGKSMVHVYILQDGVWHMITSATCPHGLYFRPENLVVDSKIYILSASGEDVIVLDLTTSSFSTIQLPEGVKYDYYKSILSRADDASSVYLIHVVEFQLCVWLHKGNNWLLVDTICLHEMLAMLGMSFHTLEDEGVLSVSIIHVGDNGQFVFLEVGQCLFYLDIKCRKPRKLFQNKVKDEYLAGLHYVMMIWPPTFPALKDDPARNDT